MRIFKKANWKYESCLICGNKDEGEVVLVGIDGTEDDGNVRAKQIHLKCIELNYNEKMNVLYQKL